MGYSSDSRNGGCPVCTVKFHIPLNDTCICIQCIVLNILVDFPAVNDKLEHTVENPWHNLKSESQLCGREVHVITDDRNVNESMGQ